MKRSLLLAAALVLLVVLPALANHGNFCVGGGTLRHTFGTPNFTGSDASECVGESTEHTNTSGVWVLNGGNDEAYSAGGSDRIEGNEGNDGPLQGGTGADTIIGGLGDDVIAETGSGQGGSDTSHDTLTGNGGNDRIYGGGGSDEINCGPGGNDTVFHIHDGVGDSISGCENHND